MKRTSNFGEWVRHQLHQAGRPQARRFKGIGRPERLEIRTLLTGNVSVQMIGHDLHINGSSDADSVVITASGTALVVRGLDGTRINGTTGVDFVARGDIPALKGNLYANMQGGNDTFIVANGVNLRRYNYITLGDGDDTFGLHNAIARKHLSVSTGEGNDSISLLESVVEKDASLTSDGGNDVVSIRNSVVGDNLFIGTGFGDDSVVIEGMRGPHTVGYAATIQTSFGNDSVVIRNAIIRRELNVDTSFGDDFLQTSGTTVGRDAWLFLGDGTDNAVFSGTNTFNGNATLFGQSGTDSVETSAQTAFARSRNFFDVDATTVSDTLEADRLNNVTTGALTLATALQQRIAALVTVPVLTVTITPTTLLENAGTNAITGTVSRATASNVAVTVTLSGNDTTELTVPATVTIPANQTSVTFNITAVDDAFVDGSKTVTVTASANGFTNGTDTIDVTDNETGPAALTVSLSNNTVLENAGAAASTGTVTRNTDNTAALTVTLVSGDTTEATVPATVTIAAGQNSITFAIAAVDDATADGSLPVVITASATGLANGTATLTVQDSEIALNLDPVLTNTVQSSGTLITKQSTIAVNGTTAANATVELDTDGDGFDDGSATANGTGAFSIVASLAHTTTNRGANNLRFRATPATGTGQTISELDVHRALGSVTRFTSTLGTFDVELLDVVPTGGVAAPNTVANFKSYFPSYTNSIIHRSPSDFVIQGGGFTANNAVVAPVTTTAAITNEFNAANSNVRGTLSMALLGGQPNSGTSGWFVNVRDNLNLNAANALHTVFGRVIGDGMDIVDTLNSIPIFNLNRQLSGSAFGQLPLIGTIPFEDLTGTVSVAAGSASVSGVGTAFTTQLAARDSVNGVPGSTIRIGTETFEVATITNNTQLSLTSVAATARNGVVAQRHADPLQSNYIAFSSIGEILNGLAP